MMAGPSSSAEAKCLTRPAQPLISSTLTHSVDYYCMRRQLPSKHQAKRTVTPGTMQARLTWHGGFAIVRVDLQGGMHANCKSLLCCMESLLGGVAPCVANDQDVVAEEIHGMADKHDVLIPVHELHSRQACLQYILDLDNRAPPRHSGSNYQIITTKLGLQSGLRLLRGQCTWPSPVVPPTMTPSTPPSICRSTSRSYSRKSIFPFSK